MGCLGLGAEHDENGAAGTGRSEECGVFAPGPLLKGVQRVALSAEGERTRRASGGTEDRSGRAIRAGGKNGARRLVPCVRGCDGVVTALH